MKTQKRATKEVGKDKAYITGLIIFLEKTKGNLILKDKDMSDYYMGQLNTYKEIIDHIKKTYKN